jgi:hypothetical protein
VCPSAAHAQRPHRAGAADRCCRPGTALALLDQPAPPLVVIGRRDVRSNNSWMHNLPTLAKGPVPLHADRAPRRVPATPRAPGLADGASATLLPHGGPHLPGQLRVPRSRT